MLNKDARRRTAGTRRSRTAGRGSRAVVPSRLRELESAFAALLSEERGLPAAMEEFLAPAPRARRH